MSGWRMAGDDEEIQPVAGNDVKTGMGEGEHRAAAGTTLDVQSTG
jgi:hypothetical protein